METSTLIWLASWWADLHMLCLLMLEGIFQRAIRPWFGEIFCWCHCHLQCQIYFGLGDGLDTEEFSNIGVSLGYSHYLYTEVCSLMTTGGDLCHLGLSKLIRINELVPA